MWGVWWEFSVLLSYSLLLTRGQETTTVSNTALCNKTLEECWKLPPVSEHGIPSNPQDIEKSCRAFDTGMQCVENWSNTCLKKQEQEKVMSSVVGAKETYKFLCSDKKFQRDFLQHSDCYQRVSPHWDACARKFIESLKRVDHSKDVLSLCCIRYRYRQCVADAASHFCSKNATKFLLKLADSLVRYNMRSYHPSECANIADKNCSSPSAASSLQSSTKFLSTSSLLHTILSYSSKGLVNSLNVLQNLAFSDITTFFWALSREFSPYFSYHHRVNWVVVENECESCSHTIYPFSSQNNKLYRLRRQDTNNFISPHLSIRNPIYRDKVTEMRNVIKEGSR